MIWTIIKKEILEQFISIRFLVLTVICITLLPLSLFVSYRDYQNRISDYNRSIKLNQENLDRINLGEVFTGNFSIKGYRPPSPLSVLASGLDGSIPTSLEARKTGLTLLTGGIQNESILTATGKIDFLFILLIVFSLLAILFTFDAICGEKEKGTLRAALSNSIPRDKFILGKYLGTMITLLIPLLVATLLGLILLVSLGYPLSDDEILPRLILIFLSAMVLISIFTCIGLFISSRVSNSKTAIVFLISLWIILMFVIPNGSNIIARACIPVHSDDVVELKRSLVRQNLELEKGKRIEEMEQNLPQIPDNITQAETDRLINERNRILNAVRNDFTQKINEEISKIDNENFLERARQNSLALSLARISPATSFNKVTTDLAWTGEHTRTQFVISAQAYQTTLNQSLFNHVFRDLSPSGRISMGITVGVNLKELPLFQFERESFSETSGAIALDIGLLVFFMIFTFALVYVSFLKYDVR